MNFVQGVLHESDLAAYERRPVIHDWRYREHVHTGATITTM